MTEEDMTQQNPTETLKENSSNDNETTVMNGTEAAVEETSETVAKDVNMDEKAEETTTESPQAPKETNAQETTEAPPTTQSAPEPTTTTTRSIEVPISPTVPVLYTPMRQAAKKAMQSMEMTTSGRKRKGSFSTPHDEEPTDAEERKPPSKKRADKKKPHKQDEPEESLDDSVARRVEALDPDVKARFGQILWVKMKGYPYWPALVADPRELPFELKVYASPHIETKYYVYFYGTKNYGHILFKNVEAWDDTKHPYREGYPAKESKAPKRHAQLLEAIAEADKEVALPVKERASGLLGNMAPLIVNVESKPSTEKPKERKKPGPKPKSSKTKAKEPTQPEAEAKPNEETTLSTDESKDKEEKVAKERRKPGRKPKAEKAVTPAPTEKKRKREPEATKPKKKSTVEKKKTTQTGTYKVGLLDAFTKQVATWEQSTEQQAVAESMLRQLFDEDVMYRSDVQQAGLSNLIATLRKQTLNPSLASTASAVRKHLIKILVDDVTTAQEPPAKKEKETKKPASAPEKPKKIAPKVPESKAEAPVETKEPALAEKTNEPAENTTEPAATTEPTASAEEKPTTPAPVIKDTTPPVEETTANDEEKRTEEVEVTRKPAAAAANDQSTEEPVEAPTPVVIDTDAQQANKHRQLFVSMLSTILARLTPMHRKIAEEVEHFVFARHATTDAEYMTQARLITFGLKANPLTQQQVVQGELATMTLASATDKLFPTTTAS